MPKKRNENKFFAMLERAGVVRRVESDSGSSDSTSGSTPLHSNSDIKPIFDIPADRVKVTPAPRQTIPGMPAPVFPSDKNLDALIRRHTVSDKTSDAPERQPDTSSSVLDALDRQLKAVEHDDVKPKAVVTPEISVIYEPESFEDEKKQPLHAPVEIPAPLPPPAPPPPPPPAPPPPPPAPPPPAPSGGRNLFRRSYVPEREPFEPIVAPYIEPQLEVEEVEEVERPPENYTDRFLDTEELYNALALRSKKTDSIYLIEEYLQTIPDSLPDAARREIVSKLLAASEFDYDLLMGDGVLRVKMLKEYAERFARYTDDYIAVRQLELDELEQQMSHTRRLIENRKELHKKQFFSIEAEAQRLKEILTFISG